MFDAIRLAVRDAARASDRAPGTRAQTRIENPGRSLSEATGKSSPAAERQGKARRARASSLLPRHGLPTVGF